MSICSASCRTPSSPPGLPLARAARTYALARGVPAARGVRPLAQLARTRWRGAREQTRKFRRSLRASNPAGFRARQLRETPP
jgi:hypothetical protein